MYFERMLWGNSWFIRELKLRSLQNLISRDIFLQKVSDIIVHLTEFSVNIFKLLKKKKTHKNKKTQTNQREENPNPKILASSENWLGRFMELS